MGIPLSIFRELIYLLFVCLNLRLDAGHGTMCKFCSPVRPLVCRQNLVFCDNFNDLTKLGYIAKQKRCYEIRHQVFVLIHLHHSVIVFVLYYMQIPMSIWSEVECLLFICLIQRLDLRFLKDGHGPWYRLLTLLTQLVVLLVRWQIPLFHLCLIFPMRINYWCSWLSTWK